MFGSGSNKNIPVHRSPQHFSLVWLLLSSFWKKDLPEEILMWLKSSSTPNPQTPPLVHTRALESVILWSRE